MQTTRVQSYTITKSADLYLLTNMLKQSALVAISSIWKEIYAVQNVFLDSSNSY